MEKNTVTRTFSIDTISSGVGASGDVSTARRHSSAGIRALLWATSSVKSLGSSQGSDFQTSRENLFPNILTPGSIPQFTIPSLSVQSSLRSLDREDVSESEESSGGSGAEPSSSSAGAVLSSFSSSSSLGLAPSDRRAERSVSDPFSQRSFPHRDASRPRSYVHVHHGLDPASRAALSLPHLAKVTTPYGFITLSQSPQMASEEALRCPAGLWRPSKGEAPPERMVHVRGQSSAALEDKMKPAEGPTDGSAQRTGRPNQGKCKKRLYEIIRKHFHFSS
ncbi:unnamed protein product [Tetraodon nigroviridis]|uniref:(spotted green pufferfish) hypothetical protein n=1 Tax=Tetraodon nigroviridis TaxID=99883 RepID=Q4SYJ8_TETNG|nr:unnamed protein product [Tetraodon nigroviridis]